MINMYEMVMLMLWDMNACLTPRGVTRRSSQVGASSAGGSGETADCGVQRPDGRTPG
jgi:hypothetical protein